MIHPLHCMFSDHRIQNAVLIRITIPKNEADDVTNDDITKHATRNVKCFRVITFKTKFLLRERSIINKFSIQ